MEIRPALIEDAEALLCIYSPYVTDTAITFEVEAPSLQEMQKRIATISAFYPYLVAEEEGEILGYVYATKLKPRAAYEWSAETTIYLAPSAQHRGIGRALYERLVEACKAMGLTNLYACVAYPCDDDAHLSTNSYDFHAHMGFEEIGMFHRCANKFDTWYDVAWMEKVIGEHTAPAPVVFPYPAAIEGIKDMDEKDAFE